MDPQKHKQLAINILLLALVLLAAAMLIHSVFRTCDEDFYTNCLDAVRDAGYFCTNPYGDSDYLFNASEGKLQENISYLEERAKVYNEEVKEVYYYNISNIGKWLSSKETREQGGVCSNWAKYYERLAMDDGFYTAMPIIYKNSTSTHAFAIISDDTGQCILDQEVMFCW